MKASLSKNDIVNILGKMIILLPLLLLYYSEVLMYLRSDYSGLIKVCTTFYMMIYAFFQLKYHGYLIAFIVFFLPFFVYGIFNSFSLTAALNEGVRYLFPIAVLLYGFAIRKHFKLLIHFFLIFVLINDLWQIINYINWAKGVDQWFYLYRPDAPRFYNMSSDIIRATGIVGFFGLHGFINLIAFLLARKYYHGKFKIALLAIFVVSMFLSFSYKTLGTFILFLFFEMKNKLKILGYCLGVFLIGLIFLPKTLESMQESFVYRVNEYVIEGNSARADSYRVMFDEIKDGNLFGRGVGSFGGPASVKYKSPIYKEVRFRWYSTTDLTTTDTFFPHLFVEMGLIGAMFYLFILIVPLAFLKWRIDKFKLALLIYLALFIDTLFSYALNNILFLIFSLLFIYPLYYYEDNLKIKNE
ncbi:MAG: hypothetical protein H0X63_01115 [Flavobacteriales bacterium]|nr:hypothetical protein [Flavobacteriales bacterium]